MDQQEGKRVGVWIRTSTDLDSQKESPEHHLERAKAYCLFKEWQIIEVYDLTAISGKSVLDLPQTKQMLADLESRKITGLIFSKLARLARSTRELLDLADIFKKYDADMISLGESIDTSTPAGTLFFTVLAALAQFEREEIAERVKASVPIRAKLGKNTGGQAPFGYKWENNQLKIDEEEAVVVKKLFELFLSNKRKRTTARLLNEAGYRTRKGKKFSDSTIHRLLTNPTMKGLHRANYTKSRGDGKAWDLKDTKDWVFSEVPAIVGSQEYDDINSFLEHQYKSKKKVARKPSQEHVFSGFVHCNCGRKMYVPTDSVSYKCYKCKNKIRKDDLELVYEEELKQFLNSKEEMEKYVTGADQSLNDIKTQLQHLKVEEKNITEEADKLYDLYMSDNISKEGFDRKNSPLESRLAEIKSEIPTLEGTVQAMKQRTLSVSHIASETSWIHGKWNELLPEQKYKIIELVTKKIVIHSEEVELHLDYLPFVKAD